MAFKFVRSCCQDGGKFDWIAQVKKKVTNDTTTLTCADPWQWRRPPWGPPTPQPATKLRRPSPPPRLRWCSPSPDESAFDSLCSQFPSSCGFRWRERINLQKGASSPQVWLETHGPTNRSSETEMAAVGLTDPSACVCVDGLHKSERERWRSSVLKGLGLSGVKLEPLS